MGKIKELKNMIESDKLKVLGFTSSGKKVYNVYKPELYKDFSKKDHLDAAGILGKESYKLSMFRQKDKDDLASEYSKYAMMHTNKYKGVPVESANEDGKQIAATILQQLGGNKFIVMTGAKNMAHGEDYLSFKIGKNAGGVTHVKIRLNGKDLYDMTFYKARGAELKTVKEYNDVYNDQLQSLFTEVTGLYTSLGTMGR